MQHYISSPPTILLHQASKIVKIANHYRSVLLPTSVTITATGKTALFGSSQRDTRVLLNMIAGLTLPSSGKRYTTVRVSFPVGTLPGAQRDLSLRHNVAHVARLYGHDVEQTIRFVEQMLDIGTDFEKPYAIVHPNVVQLFRYILGLALSFEFYVLASPPPVRGTHFSSARARCYQLFQHRASVAGMILAANRPNFAYQYCDKSLVLHEGSLTSFESPQEGWRFAEQCMAQADSDEMGSPEDD